MFLTGSSTKGKYRSTNTSFISKRERIQKVARTHMHTHTFTHTCANTHAHAQRFLS